MSKQEKIPAGETIPERRALAVRKRGDLSPDVLSKQDIDLLCSVGVIPKDTPANVVGFFAKTCSALKLSPFKHQIHLIKRNVKEGNGWVPKYTMQTGIDGYRKRADSSGRYAGSDDYKFDEGLTEYEMIAAGRMQPETATVTVYKMVGGVRCPFTATVRWKEYVPKSEEGSFMWMKMPFNQLGKCGEALALRKGFPDEIADLRLDEEMQHVDVEATTVETTTSRPVVPVDGTKWKPKGNGKKNGDAPVVVKNSVEESAKDKTKRTTLLIIIRKRLSDNKDTEAEVARFFQSVPSQSKKWKGELLLALNGTLDKMPLDKLEFIVQHFDKWWPICEQWFKEHPKQP